MTLKNFTANLPRRLIPEAARTPLRKAADQFWEIMPGADPSVFAERPYELHLELTNLCNANCVFCPYHLQQRPHTFMSEQTFDKALTEYVAMGGGSVTLTPTVGDPLVHPQFVQWVRRLRSVPTINRISVTTNGILVKRHGAAAILDSGVSAIHISTAGFDEEMYRRVFRSNSYKQFLGGVYSLFEENAKRADPVPIFLMIRPDRPADEVMRQPDLQPLLKHKPPIEVLEEFSRSGGLINSLPEGMRLAPERKTNAGPPCHWTTFALVILSDGRVQACPCESSVNANPLVVGDLNAQTLLEIWKGDPLAALRRSFHNGTLNRNCATCDYYGPAKLSSPAARTRARILRRRMNGELIASEGKVSRPFQTD